MDTIELENGRKIRFEHDQDCEAPFDVKYDSGTRIVVLHRRYVDPSKGECGTDPDEVEAWTKKNKAKWYIIPLWMYDHSGTAYRVGQNNPFNCPWDSGRVGIIALKRSEWGPKSEEEYFKAAQSVAETYSDWANGNCYGYIIEDEEGEELDACWGFIGMEHVEESARHAAAHLS